ncbi:MAG TPA: class I SAM-dependent methyltransferase [Anaerolineales bacterium]|nr:class I SAM-dependent methyltransferase [Anaerolineales bacterium]
MRTSDFNAYKRRYGAAMEQELQSAEPGQLDDVGFPAYSHANPLIRWLFWKRLHIVIDHVERGAPHGRVLDFGCGSGVMLPFLSSVCKEVVAADVNLHPLERMRSRFPLAANVTTWNTSGDALSEAAARSFETIIALDVLEHVKDLPGTLDQLLRLLQPGGELIVSGPTENALYRFGRRIAGPEYSGDYHERGVAEIRHLLSRHARIKSLSTLYWPVPLFEIFSARP